MSEIPNHADPIQMAMEVTALKGQVQSGFNGINATLERLEKDQREVRQTMVDLVRHQATMESHSEGLGRAFKAIENHTSEFAKWRISHEAENDAVSERVVMFKGSLKGAAVLVGVIVMLCGALVSSIIYGYRIELASQARELEILEEKVMTRAEDNKRRIEALERRFSP